MAVEVALTRPDLVRSLVLAPPGGSLLTEATPDLRAFFAAEREALGARATSTPPSRPTSTTWVVGRAGARRRRRRRGRGIRAPHAAPGVRGRRGARADLDEVELDPPAVERLGDVRAPVLLVVGGHDLDIAHLAAGTLVAGLRHGCAASTGPTRPTCRRWRSPTAFLDLVLDWVAEQD